MVMKLKESENKLEHILLEKKPDNEEVPAAETEETMIVQEGTRINDNISIESISDSVQHDKTCSVKNIMDSGSSNSNLRKVTNLENEQINKSLHTGKSSEESLTKSNTEPLIESSLENVSDKTEESNRHIDNKVEIVEIESSPCHEIPVLKDDKHLNEILRKNILSCVEKVALIEEMKNKNTKHLDQVSAY
jgi:hypothetical protein